MFQTGYYPLYFENNANNCILYYNIGIYISKLVGKNYVIIVNINGIEIIELDTTFIFYCKI